jgi:hypothetical protein
MKSELSRRFVKKKQHFFGTFGVSVFPKMRGASFAHVLLGFALYAPGCADGLQFPSRPSSPASKRAKSKSTKPKGLSLNLPSVNLPSLDLPSLTPPTLPSPEDLLKQIPPPEDLLKLALAAVPVFVIPVLFIGLIEFSGPGYKSESLPAAQCTQTFALIRVPAHV